MQASGRRWKVIAGHVYSIKENVGFTQRRCSVISGLFASIAGGQSLN